MERNQGNQARRSGRQPRRLRYPSAPLRRRPVPRRPPRPAAEPSYVRGSRLSAGQVRQVRQARQAGNALQAASYGHPRPARLKPGAARPRSVAGGRAVARRPRRRLLLLSLAMIPLSVVALFAVVALLKVRTAYQQIFVTPVPRPLVVTNDQGTPVIVAAGGVSTTTPQSGAGTSQGTPAVAYATVEPSLPDWDKKERVNILLLGADTNTARRDLGEIPLSDTMIIVSIDPASKQIGLMSIPRDLLVAIPGVGNDKINAAYSTGELNGITGPGLVRATIEYNFGIPIHYFAQVDFEGFQRIVDTLGGVTLDVPAPIKDDEYPGEQFNYTRVHFETGLQHLNGQQALRYVRTRHDDNDFARGNRQQQLLEALREQAIGLNLINKAPQLLDELGDTIRTDLPPGDALKLAKLGTQIQNQDIHSYNLLQATREQWNPGQPYYLIPDWNQIHQLLQEMMPGMDAAQSGTGGASTSTEVRKPDLRARVQVVNGTHVDKLAGRSAAKLQETGFLSVGTIQALNAGQYPRSAIIDASDNPATARLIAATLGLPPASIRTGDANETGGFAIMVILGDDAPRP